jgi:asparagine synthase (glutamine-hydrolysing)
MCGIAGLISGGRTRSAVVAQMISSLAHRGPDDEGLWADDDAGVGLGHRRLSIVDLSAAGHQPMHSADGRFVLTYNGEIYNHGELRAELDSAGLTPEGGWQGHSDTETFLQGIAHWGLEATLGKSVGMFAFALWDRRERKLFLVRDRFGEKPLYYGWVGGDFLFGSELKALHALGGFDNAIERRALAAFCSRGYVPAPLSIYRRIFKLEPGCILEVTPAACANPRDEAPGAGKASGGVKLSRYWNYADVVRTGLGDQIDDEADALAVLDAALGRAVRGQSVADVPVAAFLSGGIDSSTIVALYQKYSSVPVRSFTIGFHETGFDEAQHARAVARHLGTIHEERYVTVEEARDVIPLLPTIYDEPFADSSQIPTYLVSRFAREQVTVALTGDGGDELFAGYRRHHLAGRVWNRTRHLPASLRRGAGASLGGLPTAFWTRTARLLGKRGGHWGGVIRDQLRSAGAARSYDELYCSYLDEWAFQHSPVPADRPAFPLDPGGDAPDLVRALYCDSVSYLPDDILCKVDRASMAVSLETRVPFLDHRVAEAAARIPLRMKIRGKDGKLILKHLLARELPRGLFERPKSGFSVPVGEWIRGALRPWAEDLLDPKSLRSEGWFDVDLVQARWREHAAGVRDHTPSLWSILMFQAWLRDQQMPAGHAEPPALATSAAWAGG